MARTGLALQVQVESAATRPIKVNVTDVDGPVDLRQRPEPTIMRLATG
jgi:hypothetical protein